MIKPLNNPENDDSFKFYYCSSQTVKGAFLCGYDDYAKKSHEHRYSWIEDRLRHLTECFALDIVGFTINPRQLEIVLTVFPHRAQAWDDMEVIAQWRKLYPNSAKSPTETQINTWRTRLSSLSWFMRLLKEPIARQANSEDDYTGHFWQKRFKSIELTSKADIRASIEKVGFNPISIYMQEIAYPTLDLTDLPSA